MAQDDSIDTRLPYRIGYPKLPVLPVKGLSPVEDWDTYIPHFIYYGKHIRQILERHKVHFCNFRLEHRFNDGYEYNEDLPTILILASFKPTSRDTIYNHGWIQGVREIREFLHAAEIYNPVELIDPKAYSDALWPSPILPSDHEIIEESKEIVPDVLQAISKQDWVSVDVFHRDYPHTPPEVPEVAFVTENDMLNFPDLPRSYKKPTLIISARDANEDVWWDKILPQLRQKLKNLDVVVLFLQDISLTTDTKSISKPRNLSSNLFRWAYSCERLNTVFMGDSCAPKGSTRSCTLGGKITLKDKVRELEMGRTNRFALFDDNEDGRDLENDSPSVIVSISDEDHAYVQAYIREQIMEEQTMAQSSKKVLETAKEGSEMHQYASLDLLTVENGLKSWEMRLEYVKTFPRDIGTIYADSSFRIRNNLANPPQLPEGILWSERWLLDWALIQINPSNSVSSVLQRVPSNNYDYEEGPKTYIPDRIDVTEYATISPDVKLEVMKRGRTTVWTYGEMSAVISIQRYSTQRDLKPNTPTLARDNFEGFKIVCCYPIIAQPHPQDGFLEPGDSGCFILLNQKSSPGVIVGLGCGTNPSVHVSYMSPMDAVVRDIEETTGIEVQEPKYAGVIRQAT
jgi:hypothetical protein